MEKDNTIVPRTTVRMRNKAKSWKYGYEPEYDIVVISKDGTIGKIITINSIKIALPATPLKKEILNHDLAPHNQKWQRDPLPKGLTEETQFDKAYESYIERQWHRRDNGLFINIGGKTQYITGTMYFFLNWVKLDEGYPTFRVIQNELMLYWEACKADQRCYGICYVKNRRWGWTALCIGEQLEIATRTENGLCGIISKTGEDARSMFGRLIRAFKKLPPFFQPVWDGTTTPKKELILSEPTRKRSSSSTKKMNEGLDTTIKYYSTVLNAMDGERVLRSAIDEAGKFPKETPFDRYWSIIKTSHRLGSRIVGKSLVGSTVNAMSKGGLEFKNIYYDSDPTQRTKNGQTVSGLYHLFIPAQYGYEGFFDQYGFSIPNDPETFLYNEFGEKVTCGSNTYLDNELQALESNAIDYNEHLRQFPRKEEHAFRDEAGDCRFDIMKIYEQLDHNEKELPKDYVQRGNFYWKDGIKDSEAQWNPDKNGRFFLTWHPPKEIRNQFEWKTVRGVYSRHPKAEHVGAFGCDPYNRSQTVDKRGSKGSIHLYTKYNMVGAPCNQFVLEYIDRPAKVEHFFEDMILAMRYFSMPTLIELSNEKFLTVLYNRGYRGFSMNRPGLKWNELSPTEKEFGGVPAQGNKIADAQFYAVESHINDYVGVARTNTYRPTGEMGTMPFSRTLTHWKDVDPEKRTKYDAYISSSLALLANQKLTAAPTRVVKKRVLQLSTWNNKGTVSVLKA
ncbi:hypothetical protein FOF46_01275 [Aquimarina algiphila]|uniref:Terminase n=2 Tax=Aquimarina algiphila TaxID=2047982 RepID=A0A554VRK8_9FLAO|nr:hypothetical protein FOF46_01275 [Aquimarina algiphila]